MITLGLISIGFIAGVATCWITSAARDAWPRAKRIPFDDKLLNRRGGK